MAKLSSDIQGGILSDRDIKIYGSDLVDPFNDRSVQPSSYDLSLNNDFLFPRTDEADLKVDLRIDSPADLMIKNDADEIWLQPGGCVLGSTIEVVKCPINLSARVEGKSSLGRLFLAVHVTAGVIDAGWEGQITLEIVNHGPWSIKLWKGMKIAQVSYFTLTTECDTPYGSSKLGSHYQGQMETTAAAGKRGFQ